MEMLCYIQCRKGQCSMFGANATATPDGHLLQLRALDWDVDGIFTFISIITLLPCTVIISPRQPIKKTY